MSNTLKPIKKYVLRAIAERAHSTPDLVPSEYWTDFARNFRYVYDLGDEELNRIRFHTYHLTSDSYLTYYFAEEAFRNLLRSGYRHFVGRNQLELIEEGEDGIGVKTEYGRISHDLLRYLGVITDLVDASLLDRNTPRSVIELGGGYGGLARAHLTHSPQTSYFICDLEETIFFSAVYLSKHFGEQKVHLVEGRLKSSDVKQGHVYIVPQSKIEYLDELRFDYAISQQSLQEMTHKQVERYLAWFAKHATHLYSCNIFDHAAIANSKKLVLNLPMLLNSYFSAPVWCGAAPLDQERFGDNHLLRAIYKCQ
jgi:hypothetical protein